MLPSIRFTYIAFIPKAYNMNFGRSSDLLLILCSFPFTLANSGFSNVLSILIEQKLTATGIVLDSHKIPILILRKEDNFSTLEPKFGANIGF